MHAIASGLYSFCHWALESRFGHGVRDSVWLFPAIEICHLIGLAVLGGTVLLIDFRLLGMRFQNEPVANLWHDVQPLMIGSIVVMLVSGFFLFSSEAVKMYGNAAFRLKMLSLLLAIIFTFTIHRQITLADERRYSPFWRKTAAVVSILLWACVGIGGRAIGYV